MAPAYICYGIVQFILSVYLQDIGIHGQVKYCSIDFF